MAQLLVCVIVRVTVLLGYPQPNIVSLPNILWVAAPQTHAHTHTHLQTHNWQTHTYMLNAQTAGKRTEMWNKHVNCFYTFLFVCIQTNAYVCTSIHIHMQATYVCVYEKQLNKGTTNQGLFLNAIKFSPKTFSIF